MSDRDCEFAEIVYNEYRIKFESLRSRGASKKIAPSSYNANRPGPSGFNPAKTSRRQENLPKKTSVSNVKKSEKTRSKSELSDDYISDPEAISTLRGTTKDSFGKDTKEESHIAAFDQITSKKGRSVHAALIKSESEKEKILPRSTRVLESIADEVLNRPETHSQRELNSSTEKEASSVRNRESRSTRGQSSNRHTTSDSGKPKENLASKMNVIPLKPPADR